MNNVLIFFLYTSSRELPFRVYLPDLPTFTLLIVKLGARKVTKYFDNHSNMYKL